MHRGSTAAASTLASRRGTSRQRSRMTAGTRHLAARRHASRALLSGGAASRRIRITISAAYRGGGGVAHRIINRAMASSAPHAVRSAHARMPLLRIFFGLAACLGEKCGIVGKQIASDTPLVPMTLKSARGTSTRKHIGAVA